MDFGTTIVAGMAIVMGVLMPVLLIGVILWYKSRRNQLLHETALKLVEKGQPVPPALFVDQREPHSNLRRGIVLVMAGLGISLSLYLFGLKSWTFGIIPLFVGVGYLIVWKLESTGQNATASTK